MPLSEKDAQLLKQPFGVLIPDKELSREKVGSILEGAKQIMTVGDATTDRLVSFGITPDLAVIDGKERRSTRNTLLNYSAKELRCRNPAGAISEDAIAVLRDAIKARPPARVFVDGEEDLLALPLFVMAPEGSAVLYGQPLEGMVVVKITRAKQKQAQDLMDRIMEKSNL
jgi:GTP-dependent dephospho-CoA kinase